MAREASATGSARYAWTAWLFLRLLGGVYLVAFGSLLVQILGLVGSRGILPVGFYLERARQSFGPGAWLRLPTLLWLDSSDATLRALCLAGIVCAVLLVVGVATRPVLVLLWLLYLSLTVGGQLFLNFQWDVLLLETGLLALFVAPPGWRPFGPAATPEPWVLGIWLLRVLLWKLMFLSGATKLLSGDPTWWGLTALDFHYFTQPLPVSVSWYSHHLPSWFQRFSVVVMFVIELGLPWLVFGPRIARIAAGSGLLLLQLLIAATGNYGFFNLLSIVLIVMVLDDRLLGRGVVATDPRPRRWAWRVAGIALFSVVMLLQLTATVEELARTAERSQRRQEAASTSGWYTPVQKYYLSWAEPWLLETLRPVRSVNGYGLFRSMTTERPEIVIEAGDGAGNWRELEFRYKPGSLGQAPRFVQPHMPRLDWQMWFAALNPRGAGFWLERLADRLLEGEPRVLALLAPADPEPIRQVRFVYYRYTFTTAEERKNTGNWWRREQIGVFAQR